MNFDPKELTPHNIFDMYVSDCLLPSTTKRMKTQDLWTVFKDFCFQLEIGVPCDIRAFGRFMGKRFQMRRINGYATWFCEFKPGIWEGTPIESVSLLSEGE